MQRQSEVNVIKDDGREIGAVVAALHLSFNYWVKPIKFVRTGIDNGIMKSTFVKYEYNEAWLCVDNCGTGFFYKIDFWLKSLINFSSL